MKNYVLIILFMFSGIISYPKTPIGDQIYSKHTPTLFQTPKDRELSTQEVKQRGIDLMVNRIIENQNEIDLKKMARSSIFETSYGFRWKMVNLHTGKIIIVKVNKDFELISIRKSDASKAMIP
ncbi:hypothetical protein [Aquimarina pacifica]|uniref:hypothetical protein n=1 Tax=Aquimarina pacifica TaxID=1296415 RepID=UPI0004B58EEA|nr:hypothetical protein [Aquimarina pacifica]